VAPVTPRTQVIACSHNYSYQEALKQDNDMEKGGRRLFGGRKKR
jgi:hypothetical protein